MRSMKAVLGAIALGVTMTIPVTGASAEASSLAELPPEAASDIELMAEQTGASVEDLVQHHEIRPDVVAMERRISELEGFAGLWYSWDPLLVNVAFTDDSDPNKVDAYIQEFTHPNLLVQHDVSWPLADLRASLTEVREVRAELAVSNLDAGLSVPTNEAQVTVESMEDARTVREALSARGDEYADPAEGGMVRVLVGDVSTPAYKGGHPTLACTAGFVIEPIEVQGPHGFMTASHDFCDYPHPYQGHNVTVIWSHLYGQRDVSIHEMHGGTPENAIAIDTDPSRTIDSKTTWSQVSVGDPICKHGKNTGSNCGWILDKDHQPMSSVPNGHSFVRSSNQCIEGDSGGPVFYQTTAYGITAAKLAPEGVAGDCIFGMQDLQLADSGWAVKTK